MTEGAVGQPQAGPDHTSLGLLPGGLGGAIHFGGRRVPRAGVVQDCAIGIDQSVATDRVFAVVPATDIFHAETERLDPF